MLRCLFISLLFLVVAEPRQEAFAENVPLIVPARLVIPEEFRASAVAPIPKLELIVKAAPVGVVGKTRVELWKAPFFCPPCNKLEKAIWKGNDRISVTRFIAPESWQPASGGYPFCRIIDSHGKGHVLSGVTSLEQLERNIDEIEATYGPAVSGGDSGASINGKAVIESSLSWLESIAGDGSSISFKWHRQGGKDAFPIGKSFTRTDIVGTSGRIEIVVTSVKKLPVHELKFGYRFANGKVYFKLDEIECEIPEDGTVGAAQPVGSPLMIAWTVLSVIHTIWELAHPSMDIWIGQDINAMAGFKSRALTIDCGPNPPAVRLHWALFYNLLRFDYSRPLTGLVIGSDVSLQFHKSRWYRDVTVPIN